MGVSRRSYAAQRAVSESAVRNAIATGRIVNRHANLTPYRLACRNTAYDLEVLKGAAVVRPVSGLTTPSFLYTAAMMATDFGGPVTALRFRV